MCTTGTILKMKQRALSFMIWQCRQDASVSLFQSRWKHSLSSAISWTGLAWHDTGVHSQQKPAFVCKYGKTSSVVTESWGMAKYFKEAMFLLKVGQRALSLKWKRRGNSEQEMQVIFFFHPSLYGSRCIYICMQWRRTSFQELWVITSHKRMWNCNLVCIFEHLYHIIAHFFPQNNNYSSHLHFACLKHV